MTQEEIDILQCFTPCADGFTGNEPVPNTGCRVYNQCFMGTVQSRNECGPPLIFDEANNYCNFPEEVSCPLGDVGCGDLPTGKPTENILIGTFGRCMIPFNSSLRPSLSNLLSAGDFVAITGNHVYFRIRIAHNDRDQESCLF